MKKEIIISIIVVILVIAGDIVTQNHTTKCVEVLNQDLASLRENIINKAESKNELKKQSEDIREKWDDMQELLSFYIEHDELEKVETQLALLTGEMETKLYDDAIPEIEKCEFILEHISDKTTLNIKNIF